LYRLKTKLCFIWLHFRIGNLQLVHKQLQHMKHVLLYT